MHDYSIYCTESQTKKALELGAPIKRALLPSTWFEEVNPKRCHIDVPENPNGCTLAIPTADQMIGWLRTKGCTPYVYPARRDGRFVLSARLLIKLDAGDSDSFHGFGEDYSIILAAIDAALEYLTNNKK